MNMRRFLAAMLAVVMLIAMVPAKAQAAEGIVDDTVYEAGKLYLDKTATLEDDGTYTIKMEAFATGTVNIEKVITGTPLDVVLVIDQSGSIYNAGNCEKVEVAIEKFLEQLTENGKTIGKTHRVAVAGFACSEWETGVTHSFGNTASTTANSWITDLPVVDGSYAQLWTNTGIFLNDGTFKNYQTFEFEEVTAPTPTLTRTNMPVSSYQNAADWVDVVGFYTIDEKQIQVKVTTKTETFLWWQTTTYTFHFQTADGTALDSLTLTTEYPNNATVTNKGTYTWVTPTERMPAVTTNSDPYHVIYGTYTHPVTGAGPENREFPVYFVDDTKTWPGKTVRRAIYRTTSGDFYYDFRTEGGFNNSNLVPDAPVPDMDTRKVYKIKYDYNTQTGEFNGGYLTEADYQQAFMNVTDGEAGSGNLNAALDKIVSGLGSSGGTRTGTGMEMARKILECNPLTEADRAEGRERVVIVFTDGVPGQDPFEIDEANAALAESAKIKDMVGTNKNVVVYSLGLFKENVAASADANTFMNALSSNYPDADSMDDVPSTTTEDGEYYSKTTDPKNLWQLFPTIVTEDTTTTMESVYLTEGSILRDILGAGFLLSDETDIDVTTLAGRWESIPDTDNKQGHIVWSNEEPKYFAHKHDFKPAELPRPEITETIQIYNTNPNPGGNFYETADGKPNLAAPPTIDITNFNYQEEYFAFDSDGRKIMVTITGLEAQPGVVGYGVNQDTNHEQSGLWSPMDPNTRQRKLVGQFPMPNTTFTEALYVLDYAKPMEIPLADLKLTTADSLGVDNPHSLAVVEGMNYFDPENPNKEIQTGYFKSARPGSEETVPEATLPGGGTAVIDGIVITRDCADMICLQRSATSLTVAASNTHGTVMSYQWYSCTDASGSVASKISGATSATYQVPTTECGVHYYFCEISADGVESVRSSVAAVRVHKFMIARDCADMVGFVNEDVPLSVEIANVSTFKVNYQWYVCDDAEGNGAVAIDGAIESVYHAPTSENGIHYYFCEIKGQPTLGTSTGPALGEETLRSSVAAVTVRIQNGKVTLNDGKVTYHPLTTNWDGYDTFYVFGESELSTITDYSSNRNGNLWSRVKVLPANNVYYEDTFIQSQNGVTVGIVYSGDSSWTTTGPESGNKELPESGETNYGESPVYNEDMPFGGVHGWEDYLQDDHGYSDGSATTSNTAGATATFTFTGTGVDIYSYTDMNQGAVMASIYAGNAATGKALYSVIMDNFSLSDEYFQIPTLSLHEKYVRDEAGKNVKDENGNNVLEELGFGTYTVKLTVVPKTDDADGDGTKTTRYTYTLDGIRIYNPIQNLEGDETVQKAYGEEELNASFVEVRDILLDQTSIDANDGMLGGVVFLDQVPHRDPDYGSEDDQTGLPSDNYEDTVGVYTCYGPKNEVYLASGQSIAFIPKEGMHYYVGLKSPTGETVCVSILKDGKDQLLKLDHTTDLYYEITPEEGIVLIGNLGMETRKDENGEIVKDENGEDVYDIYDNLLSVTKIKVTGPDGNEVETADFFEPVDQPTVLRMVRTLREEAAAEPEIPEDTEPTEPTGPEVDIENPTEPSEPEVPGEEDKDDDDYLWKVIGGIFDLIRGIIFG